MRTPDSLSPIHITLIVGLGGFVGANARYWLATLISAWVGRVYPWGTLLINITGSLLLGVFLAWASRRVSLDPQISLLIAVGFFGAYTTFSSFANESIALFQRGEWLPAVLYIVTTNLVCILGAGLGTWIGSRL